MALGPEIVEDCQMALRTASLESEYAKISGRTTQLLDVEKSRVKHMEQLLLQFENDTLRSELDQANEQLIRVTKSELDTRLQLHEICRETDRLQNIIQTSSHETESLRAKLESVDNTISESQKLHAEKTRLSKDLSGLQAEVERLKTHGISSQDIFAEKQGLERQLNILEVQLEDENRAHERTQSRDMKQQQEITSLSSQLGETRKELAEGARTRERQERNAQQQGLEWEAQRNALERKIEMLDKKLRSTKDQLQEAHKAQQHPRSNVTTNDTNEADPRPRTILPQRPTTQFNPDMITIATPGAVQTHEKTKRPLALPGDKSAFSITPYLNRTNGPPNASVSSEDDMDELGAANVGIDTSPSKNGRFGGGRGHGSQLEGQAIPDKDLPCKTTKQKSNSQHLTFTKPSGHVDSDDQLEEPSPLRTQTAGHGPKPKKRKLGTQRDRNLFDEEEDELHEYRKPGRKLALGTGRNSALTGFQPPAASTSNHLPGNRGVAGFQAFSPLKRDKKRL